MKRNLFIIIVLTAVLASCTHLEYRDATYILDNQRSEAVTVSYKTLEMHVPHNNTFDTIPVNSAQVVINAGEKKTLYITRDYGLEPTQAFSAIQILTASGDTLRSYDDPIIVTDWEKSYTHEDPTSYTWIDHWTYTYVIK